MSKSIKSSDERVAQFVGVTGAPVKDAVRFIQKFKRVDAAIDAFYSDPNAIASATQSKNKNMHAERQFAANLNQIFDRYRDANSDIIGFEGTEKFCNDLGIELDDVVLLALAYELKLPAVGEWPRKGWSEGWKSLNCDSVQTMRNILPKLRDQLGSQSAYFIKVYNYTFEFAKSEGQRSLALDTADAFWQLLLPHGLHGGALAHISQPNNGEDEDDSMDDDSADDGWRPEYVGLWLEFLKSKKLKGVSKDTWIMLPEFIQTIDSRFEKHDEEAAWPSTIDDFVSWARERVGQRSL